jgi:hypothetical protein
MRTTTLIACLVTGLLTLGQPAWAAGKRTTASSHTASFESRPQARQTRRVAPLSGQPVTGVIPRAIRGGNPPQMFNPFAPAKYGTANESVSVDPAVPEKVNGIVFVSIPF